MEHDTVAQTREDALATLHNIIDHTPEQRAREAENIASAMHRALPGDHDAHDIRLRGMQDDARDAAIAVLDLSEAPASWDGCPIWGDTLARHLAEAFEDMPDDRTALV